MSNPSEVEGARAETTARAGHGGPASDRLGWAASALALAAFAGCLAMWAAGGGAWSAPWVPTLGLRLSFSLDGLGALYALLATGIGVLVFAYGTSYLSLHLAHEHRPARERWRFWPWMALFAAAMVGLATAQDLVLLFLFFDLTAICSYFLIGFDRAEQDARRAALMALLVTVVSAVALLIAAVLLYVTYGTFAIPELIDRAGSGTATTVAAALMAVAALAKSAQVPFHFWLPKAMAAPTPVSAYLHSAAMVAAGVLVLGRGHPLLARSEAVLTGLQIVGFASVVVGGVLALSQDVLQQVLAYSTISQYGYVVLLYGIGGATASGAAAFYVLAHGVAKSALCMTAGAVTMSTSEDRLSRLGGLWHRMPVLAVSAGVAAASLAGLPLTAGFFKDELFFDAGREAGRLTTVLAVVAAVLAVVSVLAGLFVQPFAALAEAAGSVTNDAAVSVSPSYHLDARPANLMAVTPWGVGGPLVAVPRPPERASALLARAGDRRGPRRGYSASLRWLFRISDAVHGREVRDLRTSIAAVLVPAGALTGLAFLVTPTVGAYTVGVVAGGDWLILPLLCLVAIATLVTARSRDRLTIVLSLSVVGFTLSAVYALIAAPDIALVSVVVETTLTLVFLASLARLPGARPTPGRTDSSSSPPGVRGTRSRPRWWSLLAGGVAGLASFTAIWGFLSAPTGAQGIAEEFIRRTPEAHGLDVVTVIITDFRGLDTLAEITVPLLAVVGVATLLRRGKLW